MRLLRDTLFVLKHQLAVKHHLQPPRNLQLIVSKILVLCFWGHGVT